MRYAACKLLQQMGRQHVEIRVDFSIPCIQNLITLDHIRQETPNKTTDLL